MADADEAEQTPKPAEESQQTATDQAQSAAEQAPEQSPEAPQTPGFGERGRMRRRARFLRKARELAYRDLGGLVFDLHRFGQRNDQLVLAKLATLRQIDTELRGLEEALRDRQPVTVLREVGIAACPRCAAIHGSDDRFCPGCGLAFDANADRPISTAPVIAQAHASPAPVSAQAHASPAPVQQQAALQQPTAGQAIPAQAPAVSAPPTTAQLASQASSLSTAESRSPSRETSPSSPPKVERRSLPGPLKVEPTPPVKPTAAPVSAKPAATPSEQAVPDSSQEDEPTQILRPPARGA